MSGAGRTPKKFQQPVRPLTRFITLKQPTTTPVPNDHDDPGIAPRVVTLLGAKRGVGPDSRGRHGAGFEGLNAVNSLITPEAIESM